MRWRTHAWSLFFILFHWVALISFGTNVIIEGNNTDYAGQTLELLEYSNFITSTENTMAVSRVDPQGNFSFEFEISQPTYVFLHQGIFFIYLYAEPGMIYQVKLPSYIPKKTEELLNPFFEETMLHLLVLGAKPQNATLKFDANVELNKIIRDFDLRYNPLITAYAINVYAKQENDSLNIVCQQLEKTFDSIPNPFFQTYIAYRIGLLKFVSTRYRSRNISDNYFLNKPVCYTNPAFMELFNEVYEKYFVYFGRTPNGRKIYNDINRAKSLSQLNETLQHNDVLTNDTLREFVILKGLHDGFYEMEFSRNALLEILDSINLTTKIATHRMTGENIRQKVTKLMVGFKPPAFKLLNTDSVFTTLESFKGHYVYLNFCTTQNYACLKELEQLKRIQEKFGKYLKIVTVSVDESLADVRNFVKKSGCDWEFLHYGNQPEILKDYDIRTFPTYYFIDPEGRLTWSPAPSPTENFEVKLFEELRAKGKL